MKLPPWSYSFLSSADNCLHQAYRRYIVRDVKYVEGPAQKVGNDWDKAVELYLTKGIALGEFAKWEPFVLPLMKYAPLVQLELGVTEDGQPCGFWDKDVVWGRCKNDVTIVQGSTAVIWDWKTGKEREDPYQLRLEAMLLNVKYPNLTKIVGRYVWLKENKLGVEHDLSDTGSTWHGVNKRMRELHEQAETGYWPKKKGPLCGYCNVMDCENNRSREQ